MTPFEQADDFVARLHTLLPCDDDLGDFTMEGVCVEYHAGQSHDLWDQHNDIAHHDDNESIFSSQRAEQEVKAALEWAIAMLEPRVAYVRDWQYTVVEQYDRVTSADNAAAVQAALANCKGRVLNVCLFMRAEPRGILTNEHHSLVGWGFETQQDATMFKLAYL